MNYKPNKDSKNYKKIDPIYRHNNHICRCHCHNKIKNKSLNNHLILSDENNSNFNMERSTKLNVIKTETNSNLIKSFVIYKNQIKPLFFSKIEKSQIKKTNSNIKKYSYGGNKLRIATNTNNHSYKEILGRSCSKGKIFKKSRVINYNTEKSEYNFDYNCNNKKENNVIKNIQVNNEKMKTNPNQNENIIIREKNINNKEIKYDEFINDLNNKLNNNFEEEKYSIKKENEINNNKYVYNNNYYNYLINNKKNFRLYFDYKKKLIEKKKNLLKSNSNNYINIKKIYKTNKINDNYEDIKMKIRLGLMKKNKNNKKDTNYIILEKTKKILEEKNKKIQNNLNKKNRTNYNDINIFGK